MAALTRAQLVFLAGMDLELFKTLWRRKQVPLLAKDDDSDCLYLPIEAVMLALSNNLVTNGGIDRSTAFNIISGSPELTCNGVDHAVKGEDTWIGIFFYRNDNDADLQYIDHVGTLDKLTEWIKVYKFKEDNYRPYKDVCRAVFVSVSKTIGQIQQRAKMRGIDLGDLLSRTKKAR